MSNSLAILREEAQNPDSTLMQAGESRVHLANQVVEGISDTLKKLEKHVTKYQIRDSKSKAQRILAKCKWSIESSNISALRNKLTYHNGVLNLLLTSVGNSSLERITASANAMQNDVKEIKDSINATCIKQGKSLPSISLLDNESVGSALTARFMENAEAVQPWDTIGIDQWIEAGRWWLLRFQMELYAKSESSQTVSPSAYVNLIKASWILTDTIACHPQFHLISAAKSAKIKSLTTEIKSELTRFSMSNSTFPNFDVLQCGDLQIWETTTKGVFLRPFRNPRGLNEWIVSTGELVLFQGSALCQYKNVTGNVPCIVLFLMEENAKHARLVAQSQRGATELAVDALADAQLLICWLAGSSLYLDIELKGNKESKLQHLKTFVLLIAIRENCNHTVASLLTSPKLAQELLETKAFQGFPPSLDGIAPIDWDEPRYSFSLISWAFTCRNLSLAKILLDETDSIDFRRLIFSPMMSCVLATVCRSGDHEVTQILVQRGAELQIKDWLRTAESWARDVWPQDSSEETTLHIATEYGREPVVRLLIDSGADVDATDGFRNTALHVACQHNHPEIVRSLIDAGAEINAARNDKKPALHIACFSNHPEIVRLLIDKGADINAIDIWGETALHGACLCNHLEIVHSLIDRGADVNAIDDYGETALHGACRHNHLGIVRLLIDKGADVQATTPSGDTALDLACLDRRWEIARMLIGAGAGADISSLRGVQTKMDSLLADAGVNMQTANEADQTALHIAAARGLGEVCLFLVGKGADPQIKDQFDNTPVDIWERKGQKEVLEIMKQLQKPRTAKMLRDF
ncbi:hypothetical protein ACLMJK_002931 [Lecanora helva]